MSLISRVNDHVCFNCNYNITIEKPNYGISLITYCSFFNDYKGFINTWLKDEIVISCELKKEENEK